MRFPFHRDFELSAAEKCACRRDLPAPAAGIRLDRIVTGGGHTRRKPNWRIPHELGTSADVRRGWRNFSVFLAGRAVCR